MGLNDLLYPSALPETGECAANQLPGHIDKQGRVVLIRRLVREGLLTVCRPADPARDTVTPILEDSDR